LASKSKAIKLLEGLLPYPIFSKLILFSYVSISCFGANYPTGNSPFFEESVYSTNKNVPGTTSNADPFTPPTCPTTAFVEQGFILWDYLTGVHTDEDCVTHFQKLIALCQKNKFSRAIIFIPSPQLPTGATKFDFFQTNSSMSQNFKTYVTELVTTMRETEKVTDFYVSVFFESGFFGSDASMPAFVTPYTEVATPIPSTYLDTYFQYLPDMLKWAAYMIGLDIGIEEIAFDPEAYIESTGSSAAQKNYQTVYNYTDNYRWAYGLMYTPYGESSRVPIKLGSTHGIDESKITYANLFTFPVDSVFTFSLKPYFPDPKPSWRQINSEMTEEELVQPLLNSVYIQAYQSNMPAMFAAGATAEGGHSGSEAAVDFNALLRDYPYIIGEGQICCTKDNPTISGLKTDFLTYEGQDGFLFKMDTPLKKICDIGSVQSNTSLTAGFGSTITTTRPIPFQKTEIITAWNTQDPGISQDAINNIYWMFSTNYAPDEKVPLKFFGNWNLCDFMSFITNFNSKNVSNPPFPGFDFPTKNYALYDMIFLETVVNEVPVPPWGIESGVEFN
jgi:hypothetical protein